MLSLGGANAGGACGVGSGVVSARLDQASDLAGSCASTHAAGHNDAPVVRTAPAVTVGSSVGA